jgi:hypothetical protein
MIWVQDFPERDKATTTIQRGSELSNGTHTTFSAAFFTFVAGGNDLPEHAEHKSFIDIENHFDFSKSANVQPVLSIAGSLKNQHEVDQAGGFNSLAKAIKNFGVELGGIWTIEYIASLSVLSFSLVQTLTFASFRLLFLSPSTINSSSTSTLLFKESTPSNSSSKKLPLRNKRKKAIDERESRSVTQQSRRSKAHMDMRS